jgi:tetratricopeptide (TPR) repeat protein
MEDPLEAYNRGMEYLDYNEPDQAIDLFSEAIERNPRFAHAYFARGFAQAGRGDFARAVADYTAAIERDPTLVGAYSNRAAAYEQLGETTKAAADIAAYERLRASQPY